MTAVDAPPGPGGVVDEALARDRLGVASVVFFQMTAATPITVVAGVVTTAYAVSGQVGIAFGFIAVALVLGLFSMGYVAMSRHVVNAGAFYAYVARGLGRVPGVAASMVALLSYNMMQVGLYGIFGVVGEDLLAAKGGLAVPWWLVALAGWALTAVMGLLAVDVNGRVLAVLLCLEVAVIALFDLVYFTHPAAGYDVTAVAPQNMFTAGFGAVLVLGYVGYVGFEYSTIFAEEARDPRRTVPTATYLTIAVIAVLYAASAWGMALAAGTGDIVARAAADPGLMFTLAAPHLPTLLVDVASVLLFTSVLAAMISFHSASARYMFALGRERVLPALLGRTSRRTGAPRNASLAQSAVGVAVIVAYAVIGLDPMRWLFYTAGATGAFGILCLITAASASVVCFFAADPRGENAWRRRYAPAVATVLLAATLALAAANFTTLLGVEPGHPLGWQLPAVFAVAAAVGVGRGWWLRVRRPEVYARIGLGAHAATGRLSTYLPTTHS